MKLEKLLFANPILKSAVNTTIAEYDIVAAGATAIRFIKGEKVYHDLMGVSKEERNVLIGKMQQSDPTLWPEIEKLTLMWFNEFLDTNKIELHNFVETTRDSITVFGKIPQKTSFFDDKVVFRVKENEGPYSSFFRINGKLVLYDSMKNDIRIKGVTKVYVDKSEFVESYLKPLLGSLENAHSEGTTQLLKVLKKYRNKYINSNNPEIFKEVCHQNQFKHIYDDKEIVYADSILDETKLDKSSNFIEFFMEIMRSIM